MGVTGTVPDAIRKLKSAGFEAKVDLTPDLQRFENLEIAFGPPACAAGSNMSICREPPACRSISPATPSTVDTTLALGGLMTGEANASLLADHRIAVRLKVDRFRAFDLDASGFDAAFTVANGALGDRRAPSRISSYGTVLDVEGGIRRRHRHPQGAGRRSS